ncbi:sulfotransferase family protein [Bailinhaonella thermotolerans]|uniref:Sulfotransferase n=1 Tax=Bailinhaonella thermotolerans TaxID=1070861 RepID=A0A3A4B4I7_9ACTN|nr:sulfotransferase [Bailinhaonella thermotolerans]RJL36071.1 sulfotransferase [Bailinhaonella thermotolerans]
MRPPTHILVVNGIKVRRPVFVVAAPHSGVDLLARAIKRTPGFHLTIGRPEVLRLVYAFARRPSLTTSREAGAARVLRDGLAETWQLSPGSCDACPAPCRSAAGGGPCATPSSVTRFADASPDLLYSAPVLMEAFPDARLVQLIRDGRDVAADMLTDPACLAWFKPGMLGDDAEFPLPFLGLKRAAHRRKWADMPPAGKCALRWRAAVHLSAALRARLPQDQLMTVRYEDLLADPAGTTAALSAFLETRVTPLDVAAAPRPGAWRDRLTATDAALVQKVARTELTRLGYLP